MQDYKSIFLKHLATSAAKYNKTSEPRNLYDPINYILELGGKRVRPVLVLMSCDMFGGKINDAIPAALTVEMFHNFTLIHDDIMDKADLRRGRETVHSKWSENIGILSGDALMILSYQMLEGYEGVVLKQIFSIFNQTALQICEGQQYDIDFESRNDVTLNEYIIMIGFKTAVLLASCLKIGAIISNTTQNNSDLIYDFGLNLGIAFQLQDDYLDTYGTEIFGKKIGGDILENKKTFLYLKTMEMASNTDAQKLLDWYSNKEEVNGKIENVIGLFNKYQVNEILSQEIQKYSLKAFESIHLLTIEEAKKESFIDFGKRLMHRDI